MSSQPQLVLAEGQHFLLVLDEQLVQAVHDGEVLLGLGVVGEAAPRAVLRLLLGGVLLLEDVEVGVDAVVGHRLSPQQLVQVLPLCLQAVALVVPSRAGGDDADEAVYYLEALVHFNINFDKTLNYITFTSLDVG